MTLQEQLCEKMRVEQSAYCLWLTAQPPEEILHHAYEYSVREDIILATEEMNLTPAQVRALLKSPAPLADVYKDFSKLETDYMSIVAQCVEDRADDLLKKEQQQNPPKVYRQSVTYAREHGELQQYHASCHLNERCRDEIDAALAQRFDGLRLGAGAVEQVVAKYGLERTKYVLAAAIQTRDGDGRISRTNREWADSIRMIKDMDRRGFDRSCYYADLQAHTCLCAQLRSCCPRCMTSLNAGVVGFARTHQSANCGISTDTTPNSGSFCLNYRTCRINPPNVLVGGALFVR
jgi:hypothetical protein